MNFTESALAQIKKMISGSENPKSGIRFFTVAGCCSPQLQMGVASSPQEGDIAVKIGEVDMFVTPDADKILSSLTIGFRDGSFYSETNMKENA